MRRFAGQETSARLTAPQYLSCHGEFMSPPLTRMNNYQLIQHIKIRRALWDKGLWDRIDGSAREVMWEDVAEQVKSSKEIVKARWKNLRDSYRKLLLRVLDQPHSDGQPRWRYFEHMEFIKDIVLSTKPKVNDISLKNSEIVSIEPDYSITLETNLDSDTAEDPLSFANEVGGAEVKTERGIKRKVVADDSATSNFADTELERSNIGEKLTASYPNDDDLQFLLSLYPHFKQVPMSKKLPLRMRIEKIIYDELYSTDNNGTTNCSFQI